MKPPGHLSASELGLPDSADCPFCDGTDTELHSGFGSQLSVVTYWCRRCRTAFEVFRRGENPPPVAEPDPAPRLPRKK